MIICGKAFKISLELKSDAINIVIEVPAPIPNLRQLYSKYLKNAL